tara:strand:+ start:512 stop:1141 length:630 start_codon:yes stop_codon:yes gene_type:complete
MSKKILICGFPHCGTSILKSIIGHIPDVEEIYSETKTIDKESDKPFILCKYPFTLDEFFKEEYDDYIKIFILRNPYYVFTSLNLRFNESIPANHSIKLYEETYNRFQKLREYPLKSVYTIKYDELFLNNYSKLKEILDDIGLIYDDTIFDNNRYINTICPGVKIETSQPRNVDHNSFRTYQINQPFKNMNKEINITPLQRQQLSFFSDS